MTDHGVFPFGRKVHVLRNEDRSRKRVFVLGVYASAVHAKWVGVDGRQKVAALAVASEPYIFWQGDGAGRIVSSIQIPQAAGKLIPAGSQYNGPSGRSLDDRFLAPLGIHRKDVWLCDIYPYAMVNSNQLKAIHREYDRVASKYHLPLTSLESAPSTSPGADRTHQILSELRASGAKVLILLGDRPIQWFLAEFHPEYKQLADFGKRPSEYGRLHPFELGELRLNVLPLVHPRQASRLGHSSGLWGRLHDQWVVARAHAILRSHGRSA